MSFLTPFSARTRSDPEKFGRTPLWEEARIQTIRDLVESPSTQARLRSKWNEVRSRPSNYTLSGPPATWDFPPFYNDPDGNAAISQMVRTDGRAAVDYGFRYAVLGDENSAAQAVKILNAYSGITTYVNSGDSSLAWWRRWLLFVQAAYLIKGSAAYTSTVEANFKAATVLGRSSLERIAYTRTNNWAAVGIAGEIAVSAFLGERDVFDKAVIQWRFHFNDSIKSGVFLSGAVRNNVPIHEIYRMGNSQGNGSHGLVYSNMTLAAFAMGAEYARQNGEWLFDHVSPDGSSLKGLYEQVAVWNRYGYDDHSVLWFNTSDQEPPGTEYYNRGYRLTYLMPWTDILGALWPDDNAIYLMYNFAYIPDQDVHTMRNAELLYRNRPLYG